MDLTETQLALIGLVTIRWAQLENALDGINLAVYRYGGGNAIESTLPKSLERKLKFMRQCHKKLPDLAALQTKAELLIDRVHAIKQRRHDLVHGFALNADGGEQIEVMIMGHGDGAVWGTARSVTNSDLKELIGQIDDLMELAAKHLYATFLAVLPETKENEGGSLTD